MTRLHKLASLSPVERVLLVRAGILVAVVRALLWVAPWRRVEAILRGRSRNLPSTAYLSKFSPDRLAWAVRTSSRVVPAATCLTQAVALQWLLKNTGRVCCVCIGVTKDANHRFHAHAWVEHEGGVLLDRPAQVVRYSHLASF